MQTHIVTYGLQYVQAYAGAVEGAGSPQNYIV